MGSLISSERFIYVYGVLRAITVNAVLTPEDIQNMSIFLPRKKERMNFRGVWIGSNLEMPPRLKLVGILLLRCLGVRRGPVIGMGRELGGFLLWVSRSRRIGVRSVVGKLKICLRDCRVTILCVRSV